MQIGHDERAGRRPKDRFLRKQLQLHAGAFNFEHFFDLNPWTSHFPVPTPCAGHVRSIFQKSHWPEQTKPIEERTTVSSGAIPVLQFSWQLFPTKSASTDWPQAGAPKLPAGPVPAGDFADHILKKLQKTGRSKTAVVAPT